MIGRVGRQLRTSVTAVLVVPGFDTCGAAFEGSYSSSKGRIKMASHPVAAGKVATHAITLVASTADTVAFAEDIGAVTVTNVDGAAAIYFTVDGSAPTVAGDNTYLLPAAVCSKTLETPGGTPPTVKLISAGTPVYSVERA